MNNLNDFFREVRTKVENKKIGILGFGREGSSTYKFLRLFLKEEEIIIADKNPKVFDNDLIKNDTNLALRYGDEYLNVINEVDLLFVSPGIPLNGITISEQLDITSQTNLIFEYFKNKIIGITGTKGKSTTTSLVHHLLKQVYNNVEIVGNIGIPPLDKIEEIIKALYVVFEVSSHQLQYVKSSPHIALFLNIYPEHLDYYKSFEKYKEAKLNIIKFQSEDDFSILNYDCFKDTFGYLRTRKFYYSLKPECISNCYVENEKIFYVFNGAKEEICSVNDVKLIGKHNLSNALSAICVAKIVGLNNSDIRQGLLTFKSLPHRLELIPTSDERFYYNDSIATIPEATINAINSIENVQTLIVGGKNRGIDYSQFIDFLVNSKLEKIVLYGELGKELMPLLTIKTFPHKQIFYLEFFDDAAKFAIKFTDKYRACLLSPAAASYDQFENFEQRGERFKQLVLKLSNER